MNIEETKTKLIKLLESQVADLIMMSKIELGDDVIAELIKLKTLIKDNEKPKLRMSDRMIARIAFNYAENFVGSPVEGKPVKRNADGKVEPIELSDEFKAVMNAVKYGINMGLNSVKVDNDTEYDEPTPPDEN
jgi:hypothetical protein